MYGPNDNYNLEDSHAVPGLIHRLYLAKTTKTPFMMYGTGKPLRQFLYSYDFAQIIINITNDYIIDNNRLVKKTIICANDEVSIKELTDIIIKKMDYKSDLLNDLTKEDGIMKKTVDSSYFRSLYPDFKFTSLEDGIQNTCTWFCNNYDKIRK